MKKLLLLSLVFVLCLQIVAAAWSWENYVGNSRWQVDVTEDETGCGGVIETNPVTVSLQHNREIVDISDLGHGKVRGTFSGNTLSMPSRTIPDGAGSSKLSAVDITFTADCLKFSGRYRWDYADSQSRCSGSTTLNGLRTDGKGCPAPDQQRAEIIAARAASDEKERLYKDILAKDPTNFWANWDMAELKKKQKNYDEFFKFFNNAANNENIFQEMREKLVKEAANSLHLSKFPTATTSPILRIEIDELNNWNGGLVNNINVRKEEAKDKEKWYVKLWTLYAPDSHNIVNEIVGLPEKTEE